MKVAVVILNYKVKELTLKCIESVKSSSYKDLLIIVVDNNSDDDLASEIKPDSNLLFIQNMINSGYTGGNNIGIKKAIDLGAEAVFILNPDTTVDRMAITNLVDGLVEGVGITCPKIYFKDGKTIWYAGGIFDSQNVLGSHRGVNQKDIGQFDKPGETDYATGAAMLVRLEVFESIGLFDERFFLYYEDSDLSFRAKAAGFKIMYLPQAKVYHSNAKSTGLGSKLQDYYITRNRLLFASKHLAFRTRFALFREALSNLAKPMRRLALFDFLVGNFGKGSYD